MSLFGLSQTPTFGNSSSFGAFGSANASTGFGSTSNFGKPVFGTPQQTTVSNSPFGTNANAGSPSLFGQNQPSGGMFGSSTTGFGAKTNSFGTSAVGLFGSTAPQGNTSGGGLFGGSLFGPSVGQQTQGTTVKYNPVTSTDTMVKGGTTTNINTKIEVISVMKDYENKSLEELRVEDYLAGRKEGGAAQASTGFGFGQSNLLGQQSTVNSFMSNSAGTSGALFGQKPPENKSLFGTNTNTGFGTSTTSGLFGQQPQQSPFGQSTSTSSSGFAFGQPSQVKPTGFSFGPTSSTGSCFGQPSVTNTQSGNAFGSGFGTQQTGGLFGNQQNKSAFGTGTSTGTNLFANPNTGTTGLFGANKPSTTSAFGGFGPKPSGGVFGSTPFGTPSSGSAFGATNTTTGLFGGNQNKTAFSLGTNTGFGTSSTVFNTGGLFGSNTAAKPIGGLSFGTNTSAGFSGFGSGGGLFGNNSTLNPGTMAFGSTMNPNFGSNPFNFQQPNVSMNSVANTVVVDNNNITNLIKALTSNPFGTSSLLKTAVPPTGKADELLNSSSTADSNNNNVNKVLTYKKPTYVLPSGVGHTPIAMGLRRINGGSGNFTDFTHKSILFAGLDDKSDGSLPEDLFKLKAFPSVKKLNLKVFKNVRSGSDNDQVSF